MKHKYRGKTEAGEWVYGGIAEGGDKVTILQVIKKSELDLSPYQEIEWDSKHMLRLIPVLPSTVGKWTGLVDCTGVMIYEGDTVAVSYGTGKVVFENGCYMIAWIDDPESNLELLMFEPNKFKYGKWREDICITGNIHEQIL